MGFCWAKHHSECGGKLSREHLVSSGVFEQQKIFVQGFHWCKEQEKEVSVASLTSKVLCQKHNSRLSDVDKAGIEAIRTFEATWPAHMRSMNTDEAKFVIDGYLFERWLLKTAINVSVNGHHHIGAGMADSGPGQPSPYLLAVVFGDLHFTHKMGLYFLFSDELRPTKGGSLTIYPITKNDIIVAFVLHIRGFDFLLSLFPGHAPSELQTLGIQSEPDGRHYVLNCVPSYRNKSVVSVGPDGERTEILFRW